MSSLQAKHIQVCCRIRGSEVGEPTVTSYLNNEGKDGKSYEVATSTGSFQMDFAFDNGDSQDCIFEQIVQPMLSDAFTGFNCSLFSYGQTGSGKTYTLIGNIAGGSPTVLENKDRGIIPRAAEEIFHKQAALDPQKVTCQIKLAILEVYQEQLKDLIGIGGSNSLSHSTSRENLSSTTAGVSAQTLKIREQIDGTVWVEGLTELVVNTPVDFNRILMNALKRRVVGAHAMNDTSSRSHFCCILNVHQVFHTTGVKINSKIHFIDLAGSEMVRKTDTSGVRFDEAKHINKSLSALGNVIYALSAPPKGTTEGASTTGSQVNANNKGPNASLAQTPHSKPNTNATGAASTATAAATSNTSSSKAHIPYRDSKLTRLLQNSLGGNAKTVIILTISDAKKHLQETLSTLRFGARARSIVIKPIVNKSVLEDQNMMKKQYSKAVQENRDLQDLVAQLQAELHSLRAKQGSGGVSQQSVENKHPDAVCEVCSNFLDLKLRNGKDYTPYTPQEHPVPIASKSSKSNALKEPPTVTHTTKAVPPMLSTINIDTAVPDNGYDDSDYDIPEPLDRCAICGLSSSEAEKLEMYTGEMLGEMFSCDGNCGHQFHVRCVGLLGEGGQYALPEGEWFCTECYSDTSGENDNAENNKGKSINGIADVDDSNNSAAAEDGAEENGADIPLRPVSSSQDLYSLTTDPNAIALQSHRIAPNKTPSSVLATIKAEYHTMRKERNRILAQWQTEKKIIEKYEITRRIEQQRRDQELVNAKQMIVQLEDMVTQGEKQSERMQKLFDVMLKELQQSTANFGTAHLSPKNSSNAIRNSVDRLKWASMTVESLLEMPIDSLATSKHSPSGTANSSNPTVGTKVSQLQHSNSSPTIKTGANLHTASTMQLATEAIGPYANTSAGIPKPWTGKVRTGASVSTSNTNNNTLTTSPSKITKLASSSASERNETKESQEVSLKPPRYSTDPSLKATAENKTQTTQRNSLSSQDARDYSGGGTVSSIADSDTSRRSSFHSQDSNESSPDNSASDVNSSNKRKLSANLLQDISENKGKSKFINPLKNRLKDLLKSVEAETDAFAEIRQKFKSREDERNLLRSSQGDR